MNLKLFIPFLTGLLLAGTGASAAEPGIRQIRLVQDDAQIRIVSKLYELQHVKATDVRPYVEAAVKRYSSQSRIERVNYSEQKRNLLIVSTGEDFIPYVDELIDMIDRPGVKDDFGSVIDGTGITRIAYKPNYRAAEDIVRIVNGALHSSIGRAYLNPETNIIYWKDDRLAALAILAWVKYLDRPLPQVHLRFNYYEIRESKLRDVGLDYLAWKNGPGLNLFEVAYDGGRVFSNEAILDVINGVTSFTDIAQNFSTSWGYGAMFTAPQFDLSFLRLLQQSGNARLAGNAALTFVSTPISDAAEYTSRRTYRASLTPDYQNIVKDRDDRSEVINGTGSDFRIAVTDPVVCFGAEAGEVDTVGRIPADEAFYEHCGGNVIFHYDLFEKNVVERNNRGAELGNSSLISGDLTLGFKTEKVLAVYEKEYDVEQITGIPFLSQLPIMQYFFGVTTTMKERTYLVLTAEAALVHPELQPPAPVSREVLRYEFN